MPAIQITPLGGGSEIGANAFLVRADAYSLVLDCGLHPKKEGVDSLPDFSLIEDQPEAVIVSHGHVDHCGAVPFLLREHPAMVCYATKPTTRIMDRMLHNSVFVMGMLALERGISGYPLYSHGDVDFALMQTYAMDFDQEFALSWHAPFRASFHHSGHVLGSACVSISVPGHRLLYTGDVSTTDQELVGAMTPINPAWKVDTLVIESTHGARPEDRKGGLKGEVRRFAKAIAAVLEQGGSVLIPSFALGRTQEMLNTVNRLQAVGRLPDVPVYASGLGRAIYEIYGKYSGYLRDGAELAPLTRFKRIGDVWERQVRADLLKRNCIIVATSGMMIENTPSAMIAQDMVTGKEHGIFFAGYIDPDTLGYQVLHAEVGDALRFERNGHPVKVQLENRRSFNFSAHAPREELVALVDRVQPKNVVFVHGDSDAIDWMYDNCRGPYRKFRTQIGETLTLEA